MLVLLLSRFSTVSSVQPQGQQPTRLLCPWNSPGKNTGVGCHCLLHIYICIYMYVCIYTYIYNLPTCPTLLSLTVPTCPFSIPESLFLP